MEKSKMGENNYKGVIFIFKTMAGCFYRETMGHFSKADGQPAA